MRFFSDDSPWNTRVPESPKIFRLSQTMINDLAAGWPGSPLLIKTISALGGVPVYYVESGCPRYTVRCVTIQGRSFIHPVPIPDEFKADAPVVTIVSLSDHTAWDMWLPRQEDGAWVCDVGASIDLNDTGVRPSVYLRPDVAGHGATPSGCPLLAGLIMVDEVRAGRIDHALSLGCSHILPTGYVPPASMEQKSTVPIPVGMPTGTRIQLDPQVDLGSLGLTPSGLTIARALQEYGAYVTGSAAGLYLTAEADEQGWEGLLSLTEVASVFTGDLLRRFRVIEDADGFLNASVYTAQDFQQFIWDTYRPY